MNERSYKVAVSHATNFHNGTHVITVKTNFDGASVYCSGASFGCSRDYATTDDKQAIRAFLAEHACVVTKCRKTK